MLATTFNGGPAWVIPHAPHWRRDVKLRASVVTKRERSLTAREFRVPLGFSLRCSLRWKALLNRAEMNALRDALRVYDDEPILAPVWPFAVPGSAWPGPVSGGVIIGFAEDWSSFEINPGTPSAWEWVAPAIVGRMDIDPPKVMAPECSEIDWTLDEEGPATWGLEPDSVTWANGPALNDATTPPVFPFEIDWNRAPRTGAPVVEIYRKEIGDAPRTKAAARYPHSGALSLSGQVLLRDRAAVAGLLRWWRDRSGDVGPHYVSSEANVTTVTADASAGASSLVVADGAALGSYRFLALTDSRRTQYVRVLSIAGNTLTLAAPLAYDVPSETTLVAVAILARHADTDLDIAWESPEVATAKLAWDEVTEEYLPAVGETRGTTLGAGALKGWLYKFTVDRVGSPVVYRFTSYERDLTASAATWSAVPIKHADIRRTVRLDRDEVQIECRQADWANEFLPGRLTARVLVDIYECDVSGGTGSNVAQRWSGEVVSLSWEGPFVRATVRGPYTVFDRPAPRVVLQPGCNNALFDSLCRLAKADWTFTAARVSNTGNQVTLGTWAKSGGLPTGWGFADYFALGWIEKGNERFSIVKSTALSAGQITLTLDRTPSAWSSGEAVNVIPGCDGMSETCRAYNAGTNPKGKFNNFANFLGFPFVPQKNPSFTPPKRTNDTAGKK